jgi:GMP synthase (glutamine-hydrolysing)
LIVGNETEEQEERRREHVGDSSAETYCKTIQSLVPDAPCDIYSPISPRGRTITLGDYAGVFLTGSPISLDEEDDKARRLIDFMRSVYGAQVPSFGSCAGLQLAVVAAGGRLQSRDVHKEAGIARNIFATPEGGQHPMLAGRPPVWDALALHSDDVAELPENSVLLASSGNTTVQAAEIRVGGAVFWGVQYHPELTVFEIGRSLEREKDDLVEEGFAANEAELLSYTRRLASLGENGDQPNLAWQLGVSDAILEPEKRLTEIRNFLRFISA